MNVFHKFAGATTKSILLLWRQILPVFTRISSTYCITCCFKDYQSGSLAKYFFFKSLITPWVSWTVIDVINFEILIFKVADDLLYLLFIDNAGMQMHLSILNRWFKS